MSHLMDECDALLRVSNAYALRIWVYKSPARERVLNLNIMWFKTLFYTIERGPVLELFTFV